MIKLTFVLLFGLTILSSAAGFDSREKRSPQFTWPTQSEDSTGEFSEHKYWDSTSKNMKGSYDSKQEKYRDLNNEKSYKASLPASRAQTLSSNNKNILLPYYAELTSASPESSENDNQHPPPPPRPEDQHSPPPPPPPYHGDYYPPPPPPHHRDDYPPPPHHRDDHPPPPPPPHHGDHHPPPPPHYWDDYHPPPPPHRHRGGPPPSRGHNYGRPPPSLPYHDHRPPPPPRDYGRRPEDYNQRESETFYERKFSQHEDRQTRQSTYDDDYSSYNRRGPPNSRYDDRRPPPDHRYQDRRPPPNHRYDNHRPPPDWGYYDHGPPNEHPPFHHPPPPPPHHRPPPPDHRPPPDRRPPPDHYSSEFSRNSGYVPPPRDEGSRPPPKPERRTSFEDGEPSYVSITEHTEKNNRNPFNSERQLVYDTQNNDNIASTTERSDTISQKSELSQIDIRFSADADVPTKTQILTQSNENNSKESHSDILNEDITTYSTNPFFAKYVQAQPVTPEA